MIFLSIWSIHIFSSEIKAADNIPTDEAVLYGYLLQDGKGSVVSFNLADGSDVQTEMEILAPDAAGVGGYYAEGVYYMGIKRLMGGPPMLTNIIEGYHVGSWEATGFTSITGAYAATYSAATDNVYLYHSTSGNIIRYSTPSLGATKYMGSAGHTPLTLVTDPEGKLYSISTAGVLYTWDMDSWTEEEVGALGIALDNSVVGMGAVFSKQSGDYFYLAATLQDGTTGLYRVDTLDGTTTKLYDFPNNEVYISLFFDNGRIPDGVPGIAEDIQFTITDFENPVIGTIDFTVPTITFGGGELNGKVSAQVYLNDELIDELENLTPGTPASTKEIEGTNGHQLYNVTITLSNEIGRGQKNTKSVWIGYGQPKAVKELKVELDSESGYPIVIWEEVPGTDFGSYLDPGKLVYKIERTSLNGTEVLEEAWKELTYLDSDPSLLENPENVYTYNVYAVMGPKTSYGVTTKNYIVLGAPYGVPVEWNFATMGNNASLFSNMCTILDGYGDGSMWKVDSWYGLYAPTPNSGTVMDEWIYLPTLYLERGVYSISYRQGFYSTSAGRTVNYKVSLAKAPTGLAKDEVVEVVDYQGLSNEVGTQDYKFIIKVEESGNYYLGFWAYGMYNSSTNTVPTINNISIESILAGTPQEVTDVAISYGGEIGSHDAPITLQFKLPELNLLDEPLSELTGYTIYRNEVLLENVTDGIQPGKAITVTDIPGEKGVWSYRINAYNSEGTSDPVEVSIYIGTDLPKPVNNPTLTKNDDENALITWEYSESVNGGYMDIRALKFRITRNDGGDEEVTIIDNYVIAEEDLIIVDNAIVGYNASYIDETINQEVQNSYTYTITPYYDEEDVAESATTNPLKFGYPYAFPFTESFANAEYENEGWSLEVVRGTLNQDIGWRLHDGDNGNVESPLRDGTQDKDGGMAIFKLNSSATNFAQRLIAPLIYTEGMENPILEFWFYHHANEYISGYTMNVLASIDEGENYDLLQTISFVTKDSDGEMLNGWYRYRIDLKQYTEAEVLLIAFEGDSKSYNNVSMGIDNISIVNRPDYDLELSAFSAPRTLIVGGYENKFEILVQNHGLQTVSDYTVDIYNGEDVVESLPGVELALLESHEFVYSFKPSLEEAGETYEIYAVVKLENDENEGDNVSETVTLPVIPSIYPATTALEGTAGEENIILEWEEASAKVPYIVESLSYANDVNKITSPELSGSSQTILFAGYYRSWNASSASFALYYSLTDTEEESFIEIATQELPADEADSYRCDLPKGAKYFEIRVENIMHVVFSDFYFAAASEEDAEIIGYNVYRDGEKINAEPVTTNTYTDADPKEGANTYKVTVVYEGDIQSDYSEEEVVTFTITGISGIEQAVSVYSTSGAIVIEGAEELPISIVTVQGATIAIQTGTGSDVISVATGIYLVKVGDTVVKVNVK